MPRLLPASTLAALIALASPASGQALPCADGEAAVNARTEAYVAGWLAGDPEAVMGTLAPDAVLLPAGLEPVEGHERIQDFWWPDDGSVTTIRDYTVVLDEVHVAGDMAYSRGRGQIAFSYEQDGDVSEYENASVSLTVYRCQPDGEWRIARRMWSALRSP